MKRAVVSNGKKAGRIVDLDPIGRIVIPAQQRRMFGIEPGASVVFELDGDMILLSPMRTQAVSVQTLPEIVVDAMTRLGVSVDPTSVAGSLNAVITEREDQLIARAMRASDHIR